MSYAPTNKTTNATNNIANLIAPTAQQLTDYMNAAAQVNLYAFAISQTSLPTLNDPPINYSTYIDSFEPAKAHCLVWANSIFPTILSLPQTIGGLSNTLFNLEETGAGLALNRLVTEPSNAQAKTALGQALTGMQNVVQGPLATAQELLTQLGTFSTEVTADAASLSSIAAEALSIAGDDQTKITSINNQITDLQNQISNLNTLLTVAEIGIGVSIFVGIVGAVVCFIPGGQVIGGVIIAVAVAGEVASITGTVLVNKEISADQDAITSLQGQIPGIHQDIIALQGTNLQFVALQAANTAAQAALQVVVNMWQQLDADLETVKTDLTTVGTDATAAQYTQAITDLNAANAAWQDVVTFANALAGIDYKWQDQSGVWHSFGDASNPVTAGGASVTPLVQAKAA
jgi:non-hemolytic enterotoxin B/C